MCDINEADVSKNHSQPVAYHFGSNQVNSLPEGIKLGGEVISVCECDDCRLTDLTLRLFCQTAILNTPFLTAAERKEGKKPALIYIFSKSKLQDKVDVFYENIKENKPEVVGIEDASREDRLAVHNYVLSHLTSTGFEIFIFEMSLIEDESPYLTLFKHIQILELNGYSIQVIATDGFYSDGCVNKLPAPADFFNAFSRHGVSIIRPKLSPHEPNHL